MNTDADNLKSPGSSLGERIVTYGRMIKFSHTIFALPFALASALLGSRRIAGHHLDLDRRRHIHQRARFRDHRGGNRAAL